MATRKPPWAVALLIAALALLVVSSHSHGDVYEFTHEEEALTHQQIVERLATFGKTFARASAERLKGAQSPSSAVKEVLNRMNGPLTDEFRWAQSGTVARYIGVEQTNAITVPITINIAFAGFQGDGGYSLNVTLEDLEPWFEHVDHVLPHANAAEGGAPLAEPETAVMYSYTYNIFQLAPEASAAFHSLVCRSLRPVDPTGRSQNTDQHADVRRVDAALGLLVERLNLTRGAYALLVLNPRDPSGTRERYGYRYGFSEAELEVLRGIPDLRQMASQRQHEIVARREAATSFAARRAAGGSSVPLEEELVMPPAGPAPGPAPGPGSKTPAEKAAEEAARRKAVWEASKRWAEDLTRGEGLGEVGGQKKEGGTGQPSPAEALAAGMLRSDPPLGAWAGARPHDSEADALYAGRAIAGGAPAQPCATDLWILTASPPFPAARRQVLVARSKEASERLAGMAPGEAGAASQEREDEREAAGRPLCGEIASRLASLDSGAPAEGAGKEGKAGAGSLLESVTGSHSGEGSISEALGGFLAHLAASVSSFVRHVATPPSAPHPLPPAERLLFHLYVLAPHDRFDPLGVDGFDVEAFKAALLRVQLPHQNFLFALHRVKSTDDPELWAAAAGSLRPAVVPTLTSDGKFEASRRVFVDSLLLRDRLRSLSSRLHDGPKDPLTGGAGPHAHASAAEAARPRSREIPIFLLSLDHELPVLIDREYQAKALEDMVVIVQSPHPRFAGGLSCDGAPVLSDLRSPVRAAVMATLGLVGGLVPPHIAHSGALLRPVHDWTWTAGWGPGACVASPPHGSLAAGPTGFQVDAAHRAGVAWALDRSLRLLNEGVNLLSSPDAAARAENHALSGTLPLENASLAYIEATLAWARILPSVERHDFAAASSELPGLLVHAERFRALSDEIVAAMRPFACRRPEPARGPLARWAAEALVAAGVAAAGAAALGLGFGLWWLLARPARPKPKIN
eukprot:tig00020693_g13044.t1